MAEETPRIVILINTERGDVSACLVSVIVWLHLYQILPICAELHHPTDI